MARPAKPISMQNRHNTKEEIEVRTEMEKALKGDAANLKPPKYLTAEERKIFRRVIAYYKDTDILSDKDVDVIADYACLRRAIEVQLGTESLYTDPKMMQTYITTMKQCDILRRKLGLSPEDRAKIGSLTCVNAKEPKNPLLEALDI